MIAQIDLKTVYPFAEAAGKPINSLGEGVQLLILPTFSVAAIMVIFYFLVGAFKYMLSRGDKNELEAARLMMIHSIVGFIILVISFFVMGYLTEAFGIPDILGGVKP